MTTSSPTARVARLLAALTAVAVPAAVWWSSREAPAPLVAPVPVVAAVLPPAPVVVDPTEHDLLKPGEALGTALARHGVGADDVSNLVRDLKGVLEVRSLRTGARYSVRVDGGVLTRFTFKTTSKDNVPRTITASRLPAVDLPVVDVAGPPTRGSTRTVPVERPPRFAIDVADAPVTIAVEGVTGTVRGSLYNGMLDAGGDALLVNRFADVFAWNVDFYRQTQSGDTFRVLVEKRFANDDGQQKFLGWGKVVAAEYVNAGTTFRGFSFVSKDEQFSGYYDERGESLQRTFLKNPMEVTRITSSYGSRFHPVLKKQKKHEGVDYGAPTGTPVWSVADGVVVEARYSGSAGNMVLIQHGNGMRTEYFHLSRIGEGVRAGTRVEQKQVIGYVGSTGLSTGPHLHFGLLRGNQHLDPGAQQFEAAKPLPESYRAEFDAFVAPLLAQLAALTRA